MGGAHANGRPDSFYPLTVVALVLVVDDEADIRDLVRLNLELEGHEVELAGDGAAALAAVADGLRPDLVLLDLNLPRRDGREVLAATKGDPNLSSIPILVLSSSDSEDDIRQAYALHANGYLSKPLVPAAFRELARTVCSFWLDMARLPPSA